MSNRPRTDGGSEPQGKIVTFYSTAAASGCTTSLANVGWILASAGKKVLVVDWNLGDPGLHRFFAPFVPADEIMADSEGIVDMFVDFRAEVDYAHGADLTEIKTRHADFGPRVVSLGWSDLPDVPPGRLDFVGPGRQDPNYADKMAKLAADGYEKTTVGRAFTSALRSAMLAAGYDYVLLDSSTGPEVATQASTTQIPDITVVCFTMNQQTVNRGALAARAIRTEAGGAVRILPVPTRVESDANPRLEEVRDYAHQEFASLLDHLTSYEQARYWANVEIPYRAAYAYDEVLAAFVDRPELVTTLLAAYVRLTAVITDGEVTELHRLPEAKERQVRLRVGPSARPRIHSVAIVNDPWDRAWADWIRAQLEWAGIQVVGTDGALDRNDVESTLVLLSPKLVSSPLAATVNQMYLAGGLGNTDELTTALLGVRVADQVPPPPFSELPQLNLALLDESDARLQLLGRLRRQRMSLPHGDGPTRGPRYPGRRPEIWNVPGRNEYFTGRDELLEQMRDCLGSEMGDKAAVILTGHPGSGKTELAKEYAWRFQADYDVVWWIPGQGRPRSADAVPGWGTQGSLLVLADRLGLTGEGTGAKAAIPRLLEALRQGDVAARWLLIYDAAREPADLDGLMPAPGTGHVIVTSYFREWEEERPVLRVEPFSTAESVLLLTRRARHLPVTVAEEVAAELGNLPLALNQAGEWLATRGALGAEADSAAEYLRLLRQEAATGVGDPGSAGVQLATVLSMDELAVRFPSAVRLMHLCAFLSSDGIALDLLRSGAVDADLKANDPDYAAGLTQFNQVLHQVSRFSLVRSDPQAGRVTVNLLIQQLLRDRMDPERRDECQQAVQRILAAYAPSDTEMDGRQHDVRYAELGRHILPSGALESDDSEVRRWLVNQVRYWYRKDDFEGAQRVGRVLFDRWTEHFGMSDLLRLRLGTQLANACRGLGQYVEAFGLVQPILEQQRKLLGKDHPFTLMAQRSHGADLQALGKFLDAFALDQASRAGFEASVGPDHPDTLLAGYNLARSLLMCGSWQEALDTVQEVFTARRGLSEDDVLTWTSGCLVGICLRLTGDYRYSLRVLRLCHDRLEALIGDRSARTLNVAVQLAATQRLYRQVDVAVVEAHRAYSGLQERYGDRHPRSVTAGAELAACMARTGDFDSALDRVQVVFETFTEIYGNEHPFSLVVEANLAAYAVRADQLDAALAAGSHAYDGLLSHEHVGGDHPFTLIAAVNYANALVATNDLSRALELDEAAYHGWRTRFQRHPFTELADTNRRDTMARLDGEDAAGNTSRDYIDGHVPAI